MSYAVIHPQQLQNNHMCLDNLPADKAVCCRNTHPVCVSSKESICVKRSSVPIWEIQCWGGWCQGCHVKWSTCWGLAKYEHAQPCKWCCHYHFDHNLCTLAWPSMHHSCPQNPHTPYFNKILTELHQSLLQRHCILYSKPWTATFVCKMFQLDLLFSPFLVHIKTQSIAYRIAIYRKDLFWVWHRLAKKRHNWTCNRLQGGASITFFCTWQSPGSPIPGRGTPEHNRRSWHLSNNFIPYSCPIASQSHHTLQIISSSAAKTWAPNQIVSQEEVGSLAHANMGLPPPKPPPPHKCSYTVLDNSKLWGTKKPSQQRRRKTSLSISLKIWCRIVKQAANDPSRQKSQQPKTLHQNEHVPATQLPTLTTVSPKPPTGNKRKNNKNNTCLETTENCQKQKQKLLQHNTARLIFWVVPG